MASRTEIIKIPVDSAEFDKFLALFDRYRDALAQTPGQWKAAGKELEALATQANKLDTAFRQKKEVQAGEDDKDKERFRRLRDSDNLWTSMARSSSQMSKNVLDIGNSLLKWGNLLGGAALFGSLLSNS